MSEPFPFQSTDPSEQRHEVELATGLALDEAFDKNKSYVMSNAGGVDTLTLYIPRGDVMSVAVVSQVVGIDGNRTAHMFYGSENDRGRDWDSLWEFTDGPGKAPRIEWRKSDPETGQFIPIPEPASRHDYDYNADGAVAYWSKLWPDVLRNGLPERPVEPSALKRFLGRVGLRR